MAFSMSTRLYGLPLAGNVIRTIRSATSSQRAIDDPLIVPWFPAIFAIAPLSPCLERAPATPWLGWLAGLARCECRGPPNPPPRPGWVGWLPLNVAGKLSPEVAPEIVADILKPTFLSCEPWGDLRILSWPLCAGVMSENSSCCETLTSESDCKCSGEIELAWAFPVSCVVLKRLEAEPWDEISSNILDRLSSISPEGSVSILTADFNSPGTRPLAETSICCCSAQFCSCPAEPPGGEFRSMVGCSSSQSPPQPNNLYSWSSKLACHMTHFERSA